MTNTKSRQTKQREIILAILKAAGQALSAEQIWEQAKAELPTVALTTVYRNLDRLLEQRLISAVMLPDGAAARYLPAGIHRHHLVCLGCDKTVDLPHCPLESVEAELEEKTGFSIARHSLEIYGYCGQCRQRQDHGKK